MSKKTLREINRHNDEMSIRSSEDRMNRARGITVGTAFGGVTEVIMRTDGRYIWAILQPTEVIELIHQLAAGVGCHIHIQPRNDFASWRQWREVKPEGIGQTNVPPPVHAPFSNHPPLANQVSNLDGAQAQKGEKHETMAIEKPKNRRSAKRTSAAA